MKQLVVNKFWLRSKDTIASWGVLFFAMVLIWMIIVLGTLGRKEMEQRMQIKEVFHQYSFE